MAVQAFQRLCHFYQTGDRLILINLGLQQGFPLNCLTQGYRIGRIVGHQLADTVDLTIGHLQHAPDIAQNGAGLQFTKGDDLRHLVGTIFLLNIGNDFVAAVLTEIDIEVRHRNTFGIQKPLEQQVIAQRVQICDGQRPGDDRPRPGPTARPNRYFLRLGPLDEIRNDQEVTGKAHLTDHA